MDWKIVKKKQKKHTKKTSNIQPTQPTQPKFRMLTARDFSLSEIEKKILKDHPTFKGSCICCDAHVISEIIKRPIYSCEKCFCCVGDEIICMDFDIYVCETDSSKTFSMKRDY